jgi:hypothetical protein
MVCIRLLVQCAILLVGIGSYDVTAQIVSGETGTWASSSTSNYMRHRSQRAKTL